ncbi:MAG: ATP synthase F1 subunit delta [Candidatus Kapaibacteriota bacterium]
MASSTRIAQRYASALMDQALADGTLEQINSDFQYIMSLVRESDEMVAVLNSPVIRYNAKVGILKEVFGSHVSTLMMNFLIMLAEKRRESILPDIAASFTEMYNEEKKFIPVGFTSAVELDETMRATLIDTIAKRTGKTVLPTFSVDDALKGGITIRIADTMIDASLRHQLDILYRELTGSVAHSTM